MNEKQINWCNCGRQYQEYWRINEERIGAGGRPKMKILSCGAGMQSTALALMACEQAITGASLYPDVPIYDATIFCDLGLEPVWVKQQV